MTFEINGSKSKVSRLAVGSNTPQRSVIGAEATWTPSFQVPGDWLYRKDHAWTECDSIGHYEARSAGPSTGVRQRGRRECFYGWPQLLKMALSRPFSCNEAKEAFVLASSS